MHRASVAVPTGIVDQQVRSKTRSDGERHLFIFPRPLDVVVKVRLFLALLLDDLHEDPWKVSVLDKYVSWVNGDSAVSKEDLGERSLPRNVMRVSKGL